MSATTEAIQAREPGGAKILIVDDDVRSLSLVGRLLMDEGYRIHAAVGGRAAIRIAEQVLPDLILLDIRMPDLDGIATCRVLKGQPATRAIPVVFLTGRDDEPSLLEAFDAGAADYVVKPFEPRILLARVRTHAALGVLSRGLERALARRTRELEDANAKLRRLALDLSLLEEATRARLASELHDSPMQKLALAQIHIEVGTQDPDDETQQRLAVGRALLREAIGELRTLQFDLSPPALERKGLAAALEWLAESTASRWGIRLRCACDPGLAGLPPEVSIILFQCARELVYNLLKHARASEGAIELHPRDGWLELIVEDDGIGFAPDSKDLPRRPGGGFGLSSVRERLALLDGELRVESAAPGTRMRIRLPIAASEETCRPSQDAAGR